MTDSWKMTALRMILRSEIQQAAEHREKKFKAYKELRPVVMKWAIDRKIEDERFIHNSMDCNHAQGPDWVDPTWYLQANWTNSSQNGPPEGIPQLTTCTIVEWAMDAGKGGSKGGTGPSNPNPAQGHFHNTSSSPSPEVLLSWL